MLEQLINEYLAKHPTHTREQAYPFIIGMLSALITEDKMPELIETVKTFA